jgi:hypothetical protein
MYSKRPDTAAGSEEGTVSNIYYRDYRIEIRSCALPDGWSAQIRIWSCYGGTSRMIKVIDLSTHLAFATVKEAYAHAEKVVRYWLDEELPAKERRPPQPQALPPKRQKVS